MGTLLALVAFSLKEGFLFLPRGQLNAARALCTYSIVSAWPKVAVRSVRRRTSADFPRPLDGFHTDNPRGCGVGSDVVARISE